jgi:hypothetical protein
VILRWRIARWKVRERRFRAWHWKRWSLFLSRLPHRWLPLSPMRHLELDLIRNAITDRRAILAGPHLAFLPSPLSIGPTAADLQCSGWNARLTEDQRQLEADQADLRALTGASR